MDTQFLVSLSFIIATFALYIGIAWYNRARQTSDFYVANRGVPAFWNGMAIGGDWMSAASFMGLAGTVFLMGYDAAAYLMGWTGGYLLLTFLLAPQLRKFGRMTVPEFIGDRYDSDAARIIAAIATLIISFVYIIGQLSGSGVVLGRLLEIPNWIGVLLGIVLIAIYSMFGGMKGVTWTQVAQYIILIIAYLIPVIFMSFQVTGNPLPWLTYGQVVEQIGSIERDLGLKEFWAPFQSASKLHFLAFMFTLMCGTASLPHVIVRFFTVATMRGARWSGFWALLFIGLLYLSAPAYAAFSRFIMMTQVVGSKLEELPDWTSAWIATNYLSFATAPGEVIKWEDIKIHADIVVMATPEIANLGIFVIALMAAGAMAAALSTAASLLVAISSSYAHDIYYRIINPQASEEKRLKIGRLSILVAVIIGGLIALNPPGLIAQMVAWAFAIASGSFFAALILGVWWKRVTTNAVVWGMGVGMAVTITYILLSRFGGIALFGIKDTGAGVFGMFFGFVIMITVSLLSPPPPKHLVEQAIDLRYPETMTYKDGEVWMDDSASR